jgi:hypothetical protein
LGDHLDQLSCEERQAVTQCLINTVLVTGEEVAVHFMLPFESTPQVSQRRRIEPEGTPGHVYRLRLAHFQMPLVARLRPPMPKLIRIGLADLAAPLPHRVIRHRDTAGRQEFFHIAITESEPVIEPHRVAYDLNCEAVIFIPIDGWCVHAPSMSHPVSARQAAQQVDKAQLGSHWIYRGRIASTDVKISSPFY